MALSADRNIDAVDPGRLVKGKAKASQHIFKGSLVMRDNTGFIIPGADTASCTFCGVSKGHVDSSAANVEFDMYAAGDFEFAFTTTASQALVGYTAYISDDQTVATKATTSNDVPCGKIVEFISATSVRVRIDGYADGHPNALGDS